MNREFAALLDAGPPTAEAIDRFIAGRSFPLVDANGVHFVYRGEADAVLLQHWEGDLRCPIAQSEELFVALKLCGVEVEFVRYPGGSHGGRTPSQAVDALERQLDWWARHLPGSRRR